MREIVLDTETTGLDPERGHRIVEIGCLELQNHLPTGETFQSYLNPERDMPEEAFKIHGLSNAFLADFPVFADVAEDFIAFLGKAPLIIHNAAFDLKFLDAELARAGHSSLASRKVVDTVLLARRRFPGAQVSLDALCRRFEIDNTKRTLHGALLDCELLASVYLELKGGRQPGFELASASGGAPAARDPAAGERPTRPPRPHAASPEEAAAHAAYIDGLKDPLWRR